jgi:hypothetical protein
MACEMVIRPIGSIIPGAEPEKYIRPEVMDQIIDSILAEADRGKLLFGAITKSGCNDFETKDYERVVIHRFRHRCRLPNPEIEGTATITRKEPSCTPKTSRSLAASLRIATCQTSFAMIG